MGLPYSYTDTALASTSATVANTSATILDAERSQMKSIQFICSAFTSGSGAFGVEVSNDGTNWIVYNRLVSNVTNTNAQFDTRAAAPTLSSATSSIHFFPDSDLFKYIRVFVTVTGTGTYKALFTHGG